MYTLHYNSFLLKISRPKDEKSNDSNYSVHILIWKNDAPLFKISSLHIIYQISPEIHLFNICLSKYYNILLNLDW